MHDNSKPLAISMGEPAGIGPDCILQSYAALKSAGTAPKLIVFGDPALFESRAARLDLDIKVTGLSHVEQASDLPTGTLAVVHIGNVADAPGALDPATGIHTVAAIRTALDSIKAGVCSGLVTAPIHKSNLYATGFAFPGHTEFLEDYARTHDPDSNPLAVMMLAGPELRTVPVTVHIPLHQVASSLTTARIVEIGTRTAQDLIGRFGIVYPRLAIAGLNPHAGEDGALGAEDEAVIAPAVAALKNAGIDA
ncbi:MAG: 4-hydroxythreonine-4-phosphate dehydrogenase PdxA, partial [Devosiaceae bacterium]